MNRLGALDIQLFILFYFDLTHDSQRSGLDKFAFHTLQDLQVSSIHLTAANGAVP